MKCQYYLRVNRASIPEDVDLHITHLVNHADAETFLIIIEQENVSTPVMVSIWLGENSMHRSHCSNNL